MALIPWTLYTEPVVGRNHPTLADVDNRPLREVLTLSGVDPDADFEGFLTLGTDPTFNNVHITNDLTVGGDVAIVGNISNTGNAPWVKKSGDTMTGGLTVTQITYSTAIGKLIPGVTSFSLRDNADDADNVLVNDDGTVTFRNTVTISAGGISITGGINITGDSTVTGKLNVTNDFSVNTNKFKVTASTGAIAGATTVNTINSIIINAGAVSNVTTLGSSGAATLDTGASGSSFGGALTVTGLINGQTISSTASFTGTVNVTTSVTTPLLTKAGTLAISATGGNAITFASNTISLNAAGTLSVTGSSYTAGHAVLGFQAASGELPPGASLYNDSSSSGDKGLSLGNLAGTSGAVTAGVYFNGTAFFSAWEFANTVSGPTNLRLVKSGGTVSIGSNFSAGNGVLIVYNGAADPGGSYAIRVGAGGINVVGNSLVTGTLTTTDNVTIQNAGSTAELTVSKTGTGAQGVQLFAQADNIGFFDSTNSVYVFQYTPSTTIFSIPGHLKLGNAYAAGVVAATGTIDVKDSTGTTYHVLVHT